MSEQQQQARGTWVVEWAIDLDPDDATTPVEAARRVWTETFGRGPSPTDEEACTFTVTDPDGTSHQVDLAHPEKARPFKGAPPVTTVEVTMPSGHVEAFHLPMGARVRTDGEVLSIEPEEEAP